ncbi:isocitrate lyase/phosphoenolpyruvate mutase family protein [Mesorhizobium sp. NBSH29]|uniref:isocitrate lyase/PEP mutase family protein n=1 Tax=Mesorhizobium sp. NBSH29 TaxID=2654249 RepID=UPI001896972F|nr:isocitrate lyase/phosphoenolpyruvate mutase family protein [Mesorhizobium sp. NBSH29]QPC86446.1 isocitrate lyase/phosphoenolpyruvate mutase family protein [Mesorhizobium sp. NBSH29]
MDKGKIFRDLHQSTFVMPNPGDIGTARLLEEAGFSALATSSAGFAFTQALPDGGVGFDHMITHCAEMARAVSVPVSADLERGKGDSADSAAETIIAAEAAGLAGCSIEDFSGDIARPIYDFDHAVERVAAAVEAVRSLSRDFVFTARTENFLWGRPDLDDTIRRLQAFEKAGADVLFAPGISDPQMLKTICESVIKPVSVIASTAMTVEQVAGLGVRRISLGPRLTQVAFGAVARAAREIFDRGSFTFMGEATPFGELQSLFSKG